MRDLALAEAAGPSPASGAPTGRSCRPQGWTLLRHAIALAALLVALLPALSPLAEPGIPGTNDGQFHLYRLYFLHRGLVEEGSLGRWLPDVAYGYGAPVFNYYAPGAYLPGLAAVLLGSGYVVGLKLSYGLAILLSALAMLMLARSLFGLIPAVAAAAIYAHLPYQMLNLYVRGALAESMAFVWLPLVPWCLLRLRVDGGARWLVGLALATAGLLVTHNITSLLALPAFAVLAVILGWPGAGASRPAARQHLLRAALGLALGVGLGAAYWLPAVVEKDLVQADQALSPRESLLTYFVQAWPPFQTGLAHYYGSLGGADSADTKIHVAHIAIAAAGAVAAVRTRGAGGRLLLWAGGLFVIAWALQFRFAAPLFELLPLVGYVQFPWRLLSLVGLATGILVGALVQAVPPRRGVRLLAGAALVALSGYVSLARLTPEQTLVEDRYLTAEGSLRNEQADFSLGTTVFGEFLPRSLSYHGTDAIRRAIVGTDDRDRPAGAREPVDFRVEVREWTARHLRLHVDAPRADRLLVHQNYFPGWEAWVDGLPVSVVPGGHFGLVALDLPAGTHEIELYFGSTMPRRAGWAATVASVVALVLLLAMTARSIARRCVVGAPIGALVIAVAIGGVGWSWSPAVSKGEDRWQEVGEGLVLVRSGSDLSRAGDDGLLTVVLDWLSLAGRGEEYDAWIRLVAADGTRREARWAYGSVMGAWDRGELVRTKTDLRLPRTFPAGPARLSLLLARRDRRDPAAVQEIDLDVVSVPPQRDVLSGVTFSIPADRRVLDVLELRSYELRGEGVTGRTTVHPGDALDAYLDWRVARPALQDVNVSLELRGARSPVGSAPRNVGEWFHPFLGWQTGDEIGQQLRLTVPRNARPGTYEVWLRATVRRRSWARLGPDGATSRTEGQAEIRLGSVTVDRRPFLSGPLIGLPRTAFGPRRIAGAQGRIMRPDYTALE